MIVCFVGGPLSTTPQIDEKFLKDEKAPAANRAVLRFATENIGKKLGDGECITLAFQALRAAKRKSAGLVDGAPKWGTLIVTFRPGEGSTDKVLPGDILQFKDARFEGKSYFQVAPFHTAIVSKVERGRLYVLHQNWGPKDSERPVVGAVFIMDDLKRGSVRAERPSAD
jgi:hypothetical protein